DYSRRVAMSDPSLNEVERRHASLQNDRRLLSFDDATRRIIEAILDSKGELKAELEAQTKELYWRHDVSDVLAQERHEQTISAIQNLPLRFGWNSRVTAGRPDAEDYRGVRETILSHLNFRTME